MGGYSPVSRLAGKTTVAIVPDDVLWDVPFQALKQPDGKYVIENSAIFYAPSLSVLEEMIRKTRASGVGSTRKPLLLALGNPSLSQQTMEYAASVHRDEAA